jgi:transposase-like protein
VSSIIYELFDSLPPDERKAFTAHVKAAAQAQGFNLSSLVTAKQNTDGIKCPHCNCMEVVKHGKRKNIQRYRCDDCHRTFSSVTGTFLQWTKKSFFTWKTFIKCMMEGHSVRKSAKLCKCSTKTAFVWRHKVLDALSQYQSSQPRMKGIVEADDTFFPLSYKGSKPKGRSAHRRGTPAKKRGTSSEKVCVSCAVERSGQVYSRVSSLGRPTTKALKQVFRKRISKRTVVCTDNDRAYVSYCKQSSFKYIQVPNGIRTLDTYHVQNINSYHSRLKGFIARFKGVATKYLNNYLVWFNLMREGSRSRIKLLKLAIKALVFDRWCDINRRPAIPV